LRVLGSLWYGVGDRHTAVDFAPLKFFFVCGVAKLVRVPFQLVSTSRYAAAGS
jgi:hypothetical protein